MDYLLSLMRTNVRAYHGHLPEQYVEQLHYEELSALCHPQARLDFAQMYFKINS